MNNGICPKCGNKEPDSWEDEETFRYRNVEVGDNEVKRTMKCLKCNSELEETYTFQQIKKI